MLNQQAFERQHQADWEKLEQSLDALESLKPWSSRVNKELTHDLPNLYAALCQQHAVATSRGYSHALSQRLHELITRAHHQLYRHKGHWLARCAEFLGGGFPRALREQWRLMTLSSVLFFGTALICGLLAAYSTDFADLFMGYEQREALEDMYRPGGSYRPEGMEASSNFMMFGFYIMNNIGIDFRVFASGILLGVGSLFFNIFNGIVIGAAAGHLTGLGYIETFWGFVAGHSAPELIALCVSCTAGLMLGFAIIKPGRQTRRLALTRAAKKAVPIIIGAGLMTLLAAFIEAYWSSRNEPFMLKITVGIAIWIATISYLVFAGRSPGRSSQQAAKRSNS